MFLLHRLSFVLLVFLILFAPSVCAQQQQPLAKNAIVLIAPGLGFEHLRILEAVASHEGRNLSFEGKTRSLRMTTSVLGSIIPEKFAAASTLATGVKCAPGVLSVTDEDLRPLETIVERAAENEKAIGLITLGRLLSGTLTPFVVHNDEPTEGREHARQIFEDAPEVLVGEDLDSLSRIPATPDTSLLEEAKEKGFQLVAGGRLEDFLSIRALPLLGCFKHRFRVDQDEFPGEPSLEQIVFKTLSLLRTTPQGFVLFVEIPSIDTATRYANSALLVQETIQWEKVVGAALTFLKSQPETFLVCLSPYETGNLLYVDDLAEPLLEDYERVHTSAFRIDELLPEFPSPLEVARAFRDYCGIEALEPSEINKVKGASPGKQRVLAISEAITHHLRGILFIQDTPSARPVPCLVAGPGSELWPDTIDNTQVAPLIEKTVGIAPRVDP